MSYIKYLLAEFKAPLNPPIYQTNFLYEAKKKKKAEFTKRAFVFSFDFQINKHIGTRMCNLRFFFSLQGYMTFAHNLLLVWACSSAVIPWVQIAKIKRELFFLKFFELV